MLPSRVVQQQSASAIADRADEEDEQPYAVDLRRLGMHRVRDVVLLHRSADPIAVVSMWFLLHVLGEALR